MKDYSKYNHIPTSEIYSDIDYLEKLIDKIRHEINSMEMLRFNTTLLTNSADICVRYERMLKLLKRIKIQCLFIIMTKGIILLLQGVV